jgi:hypothetical protein
VVAHEISLNADATPLIGCVGEQQHHRVMSVLAIGVPEADAATNHFFLTLNCVLLYKSPVSAYWRICKEIFMAVRAKFKVARIERSQWSSEVEVQTILLNPVTDAKPENEKFFEATPSGEIKLGTVNLEAAKQFELGAEYYVEFTKAD